MKLVSEFQKFMTDTVNLNETRINLLETRVVAIKQFINESDWEPAILSYIEQGSWAHDTIIKPVDGGEFDADLLVKVRAVEGWTAAHYVKELGRVFRESGRYRDKVQVFDFCVTVTYADECKVDIAPLVASREEQGKLEVCNKREDKFYESRPIDYTKWVVSKNKHSGNNSFRKATRLIKYIRDVKKRFSCQSVLLTTLIGHRIEWWDKVSGAFADTPTALQSIISRLDDWLQAHPEKPVVLNPELASEDFAELWNEIQYSNFRNFINKYRGWVDEAMEAETRGDSIVKWRRVFGDEFAKFEDVQKSEAATVQKAAAMLRSGAAHLNDLVDLVRDYGVSVLPLAFKNIEHKLEPRWVKADRMYRNVVISARYASSRSSGRMHPVRDGETLPSRGGLWFEVRVDEASAVPLECYVRWQITNTGAIAMAMKKGRGGFYEPTNSTRRWEALEYRGIHEAQAYIIRRSDDRLIGVSQTFRVVIQ